MAYAFSEDLKWRVIFLRHNGYSRKKIAELLCVSIGLVNKVWQIYVKWGTVVNPWQKPPGHHKTLNRNDMKVFDK